MNIYHFHPQTDDFLGTGVADPDPLDKGKWLIPANATAQQPPAFDAAAQTCRWSGAQWVVAGIPAPATVPQPTIDELREAAWVRIKAERDRRKSGGVKVSVDGLDKWFHSDDASRIQQIALVMFGASVPPVQWKTMDGTFVGMTQALANQIFQAAAASDQAIFAKAEEHRIAMEASADPSAYDFSTGWPLTYGE